MTKPPKQRPCGSCPYRRDVPGGVWHPEEYTKLPRYDQETGHQPIRLFECHQQDDHLCAGWVGCHDMEENLALRIALLEGRITLDDFEATVDYESPVPLFESGAAAARHGLRGVPEPDARAQRIIDNLKRKGVAQ